MFYTLLAISSGASLGAVLRWILSEKFNSFSSFVPLDTLGANLIGGYLVGVAVSFFAMHPSLSSEWRLFIITGFLGGLTTFSTFSAEMVGLLQDGKLELALIVIVSHLFGSLLMTVFGMATYAFFRAN